MPRIFKAMIGASNSARPAAVRAEQRRGSLAQPAALKV